MFERGRAANRNEALMRSGLWLAARPDLFPAGLPADQASSFF